MKRLMICFFLLSQPCVGFALEVEPLSGSEITAWFVQERTVPIIALAFTIDGGARKDPEGKEGMGSLFAQMLGRGAGAYGEAEFAQLLDSYGIRLSFRVSRDGLHGTLQTLSRHRAKAFDFLQLVFTQPRFDQETFVRVRQEQLASLALDKHSAEQTAFKNWFEAFGHHSYARPPEGTMDSVASLTREEVRAHASQLLTRSGLSLSIVGDITRKEAQAALKTIFESLPKKRRQKANPVTVREGKIFVPRQGTQVVTVFGFAGPLQNDEDFIAATLLSYILGGGSSSRLYETVRKKHGLAYSVWCQMIPYQEAGIFIGSVATHPDDAQKTLHMVRQEIFLLAQGNITLEDLEAAKDYFVGNYPLRFVSSVRTARYLNALQNAGWGLGYIQERQSLFEQTTLKQVRQAAKRFFRPDKLLTVTVGPETQR